MRGPQSLILFRRINEAQRGEQRATLEDIMYICVLEKFVKLGVPMMPRLEEITEREIQAGNFKKLTEVSAEPARLWTCWQQEFQTQA